MQLRCRQGCCFAQQEGTRQDVPAEQLPLLCGGACLQVILGSEAAQQDQINRARGEHALFLLHVRALELRLADVGPSPLNQRLQHRRGRLRGSTLPSSARLTLPPAASAPRR